MDLGKKLGSWIDAGQIDLNDSQISPATGNNGQCDLLCLWLSRADGQGA